MPFGGTVVDLSQPRVLLIDDEAESRLALRLELDAAGWAVTEASTAAQAIAMAQQYQPDVIVLDLGLPSGDWHGVLAELKSSVETGWIPVVILSASTEASMVSSLLREGAQYYVFKPFLPDELETRLIAARRVAVEHRQLQVSGGRYRQLADLAAEGIISIDAEGIVTFVNAAAIGMLGRDQGQIVGRPMVEFMDEEAESMMNRQAAARRRGIGGSYETRILDALGRPVWVQVVATPIVLNGIYAGSIAMVTDMTTGRATERSLRVSEAKYRSTFEHGPSGMAEMSIDGRFVQVNPTLCEILGYSAEKLCAMTLADISHPDEVEQTRRTFADLARQTPTDQTHQTSAVQTGHTSAELQVTTSQHFHAERRYIHSQGQTVWCDVSVSVVLDADGRFGYIVAHFLDITDRREFQRSLVKSEERWRTAFDLAPVGLAEIASDGHFDRVNPAFCEILGYPAERLRAMTPVDICHPEDAAVARGIITDWPRMNVENFNYTERLIHANGQVVWCVVRAVRIHGAEGIDDHFLVGYLDVTEREKFERQLEDIADQANEASQLKSNFLANMSHEIRTPMNGVIGMTELLLETGLDALQQDYAETLRSSGLALMDIVNDILDFSKIEAGKLEILDIEFSVQSIVDNVVDLLARSAETKGLELVAAVDDSVPTIVSGDPGRVRQVLTNLIGNAIKFTQAGEIAVRVTEAESIGADAVLRFEVSDTGVGVAPDKLELIFHPFVQADMSTSRTYGGTGLGLSISSQLVDLMGGDCGVSSQPGEGSTFWFTIRVHADGGQTTNGLLAPDVSSATVRALIVDGDVTQRRVLSGYLTDFGMTISTAGSSEDALASLRNATIEGRPFAVALLDQSMPGMDWLELKNAIVADPVIRAHVVILTDSDDGRDLGTAAQSGIYPSLLKPVERKDLLACLRVALGLKVADTAHSGVPAQSPSPSGGPNVGRLLLAEDNLVNQKVAIAMLSSAGYRVDTVLNGAEAVQAVGSEPYDAILMDCQMPELNGYEATAAIRSLNGSGRLTPIIGVTAGAREEDRERCLAMGMDAYISKPLRKDALLALVARTIKKGIANEVTIKRGVLDKTRGPGGSAEEDLLGELGAQFVRDTEPLFVQIRAAMDVGDASAVARIAHSLKGSAGDLGGLRLASACGRLVRLARAGSLSESEAELQEVESSFQDFCRTLSHQLSPVDGQPSDGART
jgi:two-component system sensor histidine kinase/response regulator